MFLRVCDTHAAVGCMPWDWPLGALGIGRWRCRLLPGWAACTALAGAGTAAVGSATCHTPPRCSWDTAWLGPSIGGRRLTFPPGLSKCIKCLCGLAGTQLDPIPRCKAAVVLLLVLTRNQELWVPPALELAAAAAPAARLGVATFHVLLLACGRQQVCWPVAERVCAWAVLWLLRCAVPT